MSRRHQVDVVASSQTVPGATSHFQHYLDAAADASGMVLKVIASLLLLSAFAFLSLINSLEHNWMRERLRAATYPDSAYLTAHLGVAPSPNDARAWELYKIRYASFYGSLAKAEADEFYAQHVPIPGAPVIDVNDVGFVFGAGFVLLLSLLAIALRGVEHSQRAAFEYASTARELEHMIRLLAIRQKLSASPGEPHALQGFGRLLVAAALITPVVVSTATVIHDLSTLPLGNLLDNIHVAVTFDAEVACAIASGLLTILCIRRAYDVKRTWLRYTIQPAPANM
jgi:hypothetical protein